MKPRASDVMEERCVKCGLPPSIRDLIGGDGMSSSPDGPICAREGCLMGLDVMDPRSPGRVTRADEMTLVRSNGVEYRDKYSKKEFPGHNDRVRMDAALRKQGIIKAENSRKFCI